MQLHGKTLNFFLKKGDTNPFKQIDLSIEIEEVKLKTEKKFHIYLTNRIEKGIKVKCEHSREWVKILNNSLWKFKI